MIDWYYMSIILINEMGLFKALLPQGVNVDIPPGSKCGQSLFAYVKQVNKHRMNSQVH